MTSDEFTDSNILVYAHDASDPERRDIARALISRLWAEGSGCVSTQVFAEFFTVSTRKGHLSRFDALVAVEDFMPWQAYAATPDDVVSAIRLSSGESVSFWDALIVVSAQAMGARILWSEDLQHGRRFGDLEVRNPFA